MAACPICETRKPRRYCLSMGEDICAQCCGTEREVTINCPYECGYLREARRHEKPAGAAVALLHRDVRLGDDFVANGQVVVMIMASMLQKALAAAPNATDADVREAMEAIVATSRSDLAGNPEQAAAEGAVAAGILERYRDRMAPFLSELINREQGVFAKRVFLQAAVFLARAAASHDNGRPRCRAYIHSLRDQFPDMGGEPAEAAAQ